MKKTSFAAIAVGVALVLLVSLVVVRGLPEMPRDDSKATARAPGSHIVQQAAQQAVPQEVQQEKVAQVAGEKTPRKGAGAQAPPVRKPRGFPETAFAYAQMCEPELGVPPKVNLDKSVEIPLYVDGVRAYGELFTCDNPTLIGKSSVSGSTLQRYEGKTADGNPLPLSLIHI